MINTGNNSKTGNNTTKKPGNYGPKVGVTKFIVAAINPSQKEISALIGKDISWNIEYLGTSQEGERRVAMDIWLKEDGTNNYYRLKFSIVEKLRESKNTAGLFQWKNKQGSMVYGLSREDIEAKEGKIYQDFRKIPYMQAMVGEENLFDFLSVWLLQGKIPTTDVELNPDMKAIFKGDFSELQSLVTNHTDKTIMGMVTVSPSTGKNYQNVWKKFLPGWLYERYIGGDRTGKIQRWVDEITGTYGCKDAYSLDPIHGYTEGSPAPDTAPNTPQNGWNAKGPADDGSLPF